MYMREPGEEAPRVGLDSGETLVLATARSPWSSSASSRTAVPIFGDVHVLDWARHSVAALLEGTNAAMR